MLFVPPIPVNFTSLDNQFEIHAQLFLPSKIQNPTAAVIFTHGGDINK
jgi:hypothetical protein